MSMDRRTFLLLLWAAALIIVGVIWVTKTQQQAVVIWQGPATNVAINGAIPTPEPPPAPLPPPAKKEKRLMTASELAAYREAISKTALMVSNPQAQQFAAKYGLNILNVTWEDTGRYKGSSVGPNISDMTIQVAARDSQTQQLNVTCMPVIRYPNFEDKSCDLDPRDFTLLVGNQRGRALKRISLYDFLENPTSYLFNSNSWKAPKRTLLSQRDSKVLVSAQACFLPVPKQGEATFNPVVFNYQSYQGNPAVLTVLVTREGTSVTVIDNKRDAFETGAVWGQRLFHNENGHRASLTGQRESDFQQQQNQNIKTPSVGKANSSNQEAGLNMVLLIQIPLKQKQPMRFKSEDDMMVAGSMAPVEKESSRSNVENAVIGHGELEGPFTEIDNLEIERDERFPIRVTVQFYKATSNGVVSEADIKAIKEQIDRVYAQSDYIGSLVTEGETGRVTEYEGVKIQPPDWWEQFWKRHEQNTGDRRDVAIAKLHTLLGANYQQQPVSDLYLRSLLKKPNVK
ncbi:MAG: hypothetical protein AB1489_06860 [Acidobacteriota bacterium]